MIAGILAGSINKDLQLRDYDDRESSQSEGMPLYANKWSGESYWRLNSQ